jgi:hypothetical protein
MPGCQRFGTGANRRALLGLRDAERIRRVRPQILVVAIACTAIEDEATKLLAGWNGRCSLSDMGQSRPFFARSYL